MKRMMLALFLVALLPAMSEARLGDRLRARRASNTCTTCTTPAAAVPAAKPEVKAAPPVAASSCPGGVCPAPSARRGILGFRR